MWISLTRALISSAPGSISNDRFAPSFTVGWFLARFCACGHPGDGRGYGCDRRWSFYQRVGRAGHGYIVQQSLSSGTRGSKWFAGCGKDISRNPDRHELYHRHRHIPGRASRRTSRRKWQQSRLLLSFPAIDRKQSDYNVLSALFRFYGSKYADESDNDD